MKLVLSVLFFLVLLITSSCLPTALALVQVKVKESDWMEYSVAFDGNATEGHDVVWARIEVTSVQGSLITVKIDTRNTNGVLESDDVTLDPDTGKLGDQFIIPANLNVGDTFFDENFGEVTIAGSAKRTVAGENRTLLYMESADRTVFWDKLTGVLVEGQYSTPGLTMNTHLDKTSMWGPQGLQIENMAYVLLAIILLLLGAFLVVLAFRKRKV